MLTALAITILIVMGKRVELDLFGEAINEVIALQNGAPVAAYTMSISNCNPMMMAKYIENFVRIPRY